MKALNMFGVTNGHLPVLNEQKHIQMILSEIYYQLFLTFLCPLQQCLGGITEESVEILGATSRGEMHLLTLEAQWIRELKPYLNTQDTMQSRDLKLTIKL